MPHTGAGTQTRALPRAAAPLLAILLIGIMAPTGAAQPVACLECDFELAIVSWNGTARPGTIMNGTLSITNTGDSRDSYTIQAASDNESWVVDVEPSSFSDVPSKEGLFPGTDDRRTFEVALFVPEGARASSLATITVTVQSDNDDGLQKERSLEGRARQVYGWSFTCTPRAEVEKTERTRVELTATNTGNGMDRALITSIEREGFVIEAPDALDAAPRQTVNQTLEIGVGLRADDGEHPIRWDLRSGGDPDVLRDCTTLLNVTGGSPTPKDRNENGESPDVSWVLPLIAIALIVARRRPPCRTA